MSDFFTNELSSLGREARLCHRILLTTRPGVGPAPLVGTRRRAAMGEPAVALSRRRSRSEAIGSLWWCAFAHGPLREAVPPPGLQRGHAGVKPGGDGVGRRRHCPRAHAKLSNNDAASAPSDRSGGPEFLRAAWPPRAAKGNAGDSGRIVRDEIPTCGLTGVINNSSV